MFVLENYSSLCDGIDVDEDIYNEEFFAGGYLWSVLLYPAGRTVAANEAGFASMYIYLSSETDDLVQCLFSIYLLDQTGNGENYGTSIFDRNPPQISLLRTGHVAGCPYFIPRATLESPDYLKDDCLKFCVTIGVLTKESADVFFNVNNQSFSAHHWAVLWYVYSGGIPQEEEENSDLGSFVLESFMGKMLAAADRFELKELKKICESHISERISAESIAYILHLAELCHAKELKAACLGFGAQNNAAAAGILVLTVTRCEIVSDILGSDGCKYVKKHCPSLFLELAYNGSYSGNVHEECDFYKKVWSAVNETFAGILGGPRCATDEHKIKEF
ncbi:hypothetical protein MIMGU_mgv11b024357mg [Erythranthe guttata]|uniref:MATH domain-containing protein n=1 Tax=Erythranthe guttata TaxID=4155 RepID=A0A022QLI8_ERYGU|nr:hypothetical protein MIMGU_mgv11b024357mg [Erythranthe guttata]